jgi:hypothetical protein
LVRKGGRPTKLDRDIGVFLMRHLLKDIRETKAVAVDPAVVAHFSLTDDAAMRTIIRRVKKKFGNEWQVLEVFEDAVMLVRVAPVPQQVTGAAARQSLQKVWLWGEGWPAALALAGGQRAGMLPIALNRWLLYGKKP